MPRKSKISELSAPQLWELVTGMSIHPDRWSFENFAEMRHAWRDHEQTIRDWRDKNLPGDSIWIEGRRSLKIEEEL
jgi:Ni/Co efflux regulator RcnB